ncbi:hypothetical protein K3495_g8009 [Podosphaera aphanis]|nr:hypothetical protein K3495_g8009 [Podosphaera aphanis]
MQDNDPKHTSKKARQFLRDHSLAVLPWPANSPRLNPIEHLWNYIKKRLKDYPPPPNGILELWDRVQDEWAKIPAEECQKLIESLSRRIDAVIKVKGGHVAFDLSYAAQITNPTSADFDKLNNCLQWQVENASKGLKFVQLKGKLRLITFTDSSFANNPDCSSQIGYLIILADEYDNSNIIHWSSIKCKRITRSVIASELYAMSHDFDVACVLKHSLDKILNSKIPIIICIDSFSLYECLVKLGTTHEKRLVIDIMAIRQAYERREIAEVIWIIGDSNPADAMTKHKPNDALKTKSSTKTKLT